MRDSLCCNSSEGLPLLLLQWGTPFAVTAARDSLWRDFLCCFSNEGLPLLLQQWGTLSAVIAVRDSLWRDFLCCYSTVELPLKELPLLLQHWGTPSAVIAIRDFLTLLYCEDLYSLVNSCQVSRNSEHTHSIRSTCYKYLPLCKILGTWATSNIAVSDMIAQHEEFAEDTKCSRNNILTLFENCLTISFF